MTLDAFGRQVRRWTTVLWFALAAMALHGAWGGREAKGRMVGSPFTERPGWLYGAFGGVYVSLMLSLWRPLPIALTPSTRAVVVASGGLLTAIGAGLIVGGRLSLGEMYNVSSAFGAQLYADHRLVSNGPFALVRHPMYLGALIAGLGTLLVYRTWTVLFLLLHWPVLLVRARREEEVLAAEFGDEWEAYRRDVPAWFPRLRRPWSLRSAATATLLRRRA
jgi:protein-S-isoprenylcysteine O-methyltransferase Ste14